jgi:hypothetical protein
MPAVQPHPASFRDPSGFIFEKDGIYYRQVNQVFGEHFQFFIKSGCYTHLVENKWLLSHDEIKENLTGRDNWFTTLKPEQLPYISYPYEWSFDMLKDAALLTLRLMQESIPYGVSLKDATPYNIQLHKARMVFIDTLSFEKYDPSQPWIAYRQFCECFLGPLLLAHYSKQPLQNLMLAWPDGIPLGIIKSLLPWRSRFSFFTYLHIHLHEKLTSPGQLPRSKNGVFSKTKMLNLIRSLESIIKKLKAPSAATNWSNYYEEAGQRGDYIHQKKNIIETWLNDIPGIQTAIDFGANDGYFSQLLSSYISAKTGGAGNTIFTISAEADAICVNNLYRHCRQQAIPFLHPLVLDIANPSPANGVNNKERKSFTERTKTDLALALALIHHLCIGKNMSFAQCADFFAGAAGQLIIEFVPKTDSKTRLLLLHKKDIYHHYSPEEFEKEFSKQFSIQKKEKIPGTERILYLMKKL